MTVIEATQFTVATHNGKITVYNPNTGNHRTFRIRTQKPEAKFAPGARIVSILAGPDNSEDFRGFGFVTEEGKILVWRKYLGSQYERFARCLMNAEDEANRFGLEFNWSAKCRVCNRELTCPASLASGIGPKCEGRK